MEDGVDGLNAERVLPLLWLWGDYASGIISIIL